MNTSKRIDKRISKRRSSPELYKKLKPFLAVTLLGAGYNAFRKQPPDRTPIIRHCYPNTAWRIRWWPKDFSKGQKRHGWMRPTYEQFCRWYRLPMLTGEESD